MTKRFRLSQLLVLICAGIFLIWTLFPFYWLISSSFKVESEIMTVPPKFSFTPTVEHYRSVLTRGDFAKYFYNSVVIATGSTILSVTIGSLAAYSLARFRFRSKNAIMLMILACRMIAPISLLVPLFFLMRMIGLQGTLTSVAIAHTTVNLPLVIWMMNSFIKEVPIEIEESALIDGCSRIGLLRRIVLPLARPGIVAVTIFSVINSWNEYMYSLALTAGGTRTLPVGIAGFIDDFAVSYGSLTAASTLVMAPMLVLGILIQKQLIHGLTGGAVKQ